MSASNFEKSFYPSVGLIVALVAIAVLGVSCPFSKKPVTKPVTVKPAKPVHAQPDLNLPLVSAEILTPGFVTQIIKPLKSPDGNFTLRTSQGFELTLTPDGRAKRLSINKKELVLDDPRPIFFVKDVATGQEYELTGLLTLENNALTFLSNIRSNLQLRAKLQSITDHVTVLGRVRGATNEDRALTFSFRLPFDLTGATWWKDFQMTETIAKDKTYSNLAPISGGLPYGISVSATPISAISTSDFALAMAWPMSKPRVSRLMYSSDQGYRAEYDFGLAEETLADKGVPPNTADFEISLFRTDAANGLRDALGTYATIYNEDFRTNLSFDQVGTEGPGMEYISDRNIKDFGMTWFLAANDQEAVKGKKGGLRPAKYLMPEELFVGGGFTERTVLSTEEAKNFYSNIKDSEEVDPLSGNSYKEVFAPLANSLMNDSQGKPRFFDYEGRPRVAKLPPNPPALLFSANADPDVQTPSQGQAVWNTHVTPIVTDNNYAAFYNERCDLSTFEKINPYDLRPAHFAATSVPLTFDPETKSPAVLLPFGYVKFVENERKVVQGGKAIYCSFSDALGQWWFAPYIDQLTSKLTGPAQAAVDPEARQADLSMMLRTLRQNAYQKPVSLSIAAAPVSENSATGLDYETLFQQATLYAELVGASHVDPEQINKFRLDAVKYTTLAKHLYNLRWEPVTFVSSKDPQVLIERYGSRPRTIDLAVYNDSNQEKEITVSLDLRHLALNGDEKVSELINKSAIKNNLLLDDAGTVIGRELTVKLAAGALAILEIR